MSCDEVEELVEAIAAGDVAPPAEVAVHLDACSRCRAAVALARRIDRLMASRPMPAVPPGFVAAVMSRRNQERWRGERSFDLWFNIGMAAGLLLVAGGIVALLNLSGLSAVAADVSTLFATSLGVLAARIVPVLPIYLAATLLVASALGAWWWAERRSIF